MIRFLKNRHGQAVSSEYVVVFLIVITVMSSMTIYFRRVIQARIRDAGHSMVDTVVERAGPYYNGDQTILRAYEPYYSNVISIITTEVDNKSRLLSGATSGIFEKEIDEETKIRSFSVTAPPKDAY